ncbi:uncharacterized protein FA14DRAFT_162170 [Meira miltonrushii]|uniref:Uncharacterized protein n=1 Tax=Meira miltonrushii TaxID=1280837 RepID=A0A316V947_9BASI|nr:uncharacterized protein FA14DRAFT_162170 [Meira miltonrushii]PWN32991.1 hypothetical protein FA14DRAFT_162170 [Meira miltonrushii]
MPPGRKRKSDALQSTENSIASTSEVTTPSRAPAGRPSNNTSRTEPRPSQSTQTNANRAQLKSPQSSQTDTNHTEPTLSQSDQNVTKGDKGQFLVNVYGENRCTFCSTHAYNACQVIISHRSIKCSKCAERKAGANKCVLNLKHLKGLFPAYVEREEERRTRFEPSKSPNHNNNGKDVQLVIIHALLNDVIRSHKRKPEPDVDMIGRLEDIADKVEQYMS